MSQQPRKPRVAGKAQRPAQLPWISGAEESRRFEFHVAVEGHLERAPGVPPVILPADTLSSGQAETVAGTGKHGPGVAGFALIEEGVVERFRFTARLRPAQPDFRPASIRRLLR